MVLLAGIVGKPFKEAGMEAADVTEDIFSSLQDEAAEAVGTKEGTGFVFG